LAAAVTLAIPAVAQAEPLMLGGVFRDASWISKSMMLTLVIASIWAIVVCWRKVAAGPDMISGSAFLAGLRFAGPLFGCLGAAYVLFGMSLGVANVAVPPTLKVLAPGFAEAALLMMLGIKSGVVAAVANSIVEGRIDRAVLRS
jgi:hypothetical protein